ncbi:MAG: PEP/pyruvate-binding domain-containing protein [Candidatus Nanohaloarchaea archaeon]
MVQWKGDVSRDEAGGKAARLDSIEGLKVPNFFVIERSEMAELAGGAKTPEELEQKEFPEELGESIESAYGEIGMSSEVREASGRARSLVGGQRNGQRVSVRISGDRRGVFDYRLNVGASSLEEAIKEVAASYYQAETEHDEPAILVQQMVDPGYSGAAITNYVGGHGLVEAVEGLGVSLEKGITTPALYLMREGVRDERIPERQLKVSRNNLSGNHEKEQVRPETPFSREEIEQFFRKVRESELDVKFVYNRGSFYVVDAFPSRSANPFDSQEPGTSGVRVSEGEMEGEIGREIAYTDETVPPDRYRDGLISRKGGYTSRDAQLARQNDMPAIFSYQGQLEEGQKVSIEAQQVGPEPEEHEMERDTGRRQERPVAATEVLPLDRGQGLYLSPPFTGARYAVTDRDIPGESVPRDGYLTSYGRVFSFSGDRAVLDARRLERQGLEGAMEYLNAEMKLLVVDRPEPEIIRAAVENGFDAIAAPGDLEQLERTIEREERRFMLERLREMSG